MSNACKLRVATVIALTTAVAVGAALPARAQEPGSPDDAPQRLADLEARLAERYDRLELLAGRLAELSRSPEQTQRAAALRELIAQGRQRDVQGQFERAVAALNDESYRDAIAAETKLQGDLEKLLELLLSEDRDRELGSQRKRVARYLKDVNRIIRAERGLKARTEGDDETSDLAEEQGGLGEQTGELHSEMKAAEAAGGSKLPPGAESEEANGESTEGEPKRNREGDQPGGQQGPSQGGEPQESDSQSPGGSPSEKNQGSPPGQSQGQQSGENQGADAQPQEQGNQSPMERAAERLQRAQQRMKQAQQHLEEANRKGAAEDQQRAVAELERAKAELERILRQLREEEMERMLVLLEARFRKMLDAQVEVYGETKRLDVEANKLQQHELEIGAARLSRRELSIVAEADRALVLLREDGTSVAFPEAIEQVRDDMQEVADRLRQTKVDKLTQSIEEDIIAALEETLSALAQALKELRQQQGSPQQGGQPGEQALVNKLAELRMIRALQVRVNRRTAAYGEMIKGEQAADAEIIESLRELGLRQEKIYRATRDLHTEANQ